MTEIFSDTEDNRQYWDSQYRKYREPLLLLAKRYLNPLLRTRCSPEDVLQSVFVHALARPDFLLNRPDVPDFYKWRTLLFQELSSLERTHLQTQKRNVREELYPAQAAPTQLFQDVLSDEASPRSRAVSNDRTQLLLQALHLLPEEESRVIELRQLDGCSTRQCAELLGMSVRRVTSVYLRAMRHLKQRLQWRSEFRCP